MMGYWSVFFVCKPYGPAASSPALLSTTLQQAAASLATSNAVCSKCLHIHTHTYISTHIHTKFDSDFIAACLPSAFGTLVIQCCDSIKFSFIHLLLLLLLLICLFMARMRRLFVPQIAHGLSLLVKLLLFFCLSALFCCHSVVNLLFRFFRVFYYFSSLLVFFSLLLWFLWFLLSAIAWSGRLVLSFI